MKKKNCLKIIQNENFMYTSYNKQNVYLAVYIDLHMHQAKKSAILWSLLHLLLMANVQSQLEYQLHFKREKKKQLFYTQKDVILKGLSFHTNKKNKDWTNTSLSLYKLIQCYRYDVIFLNRKIPIVSPLTPTHFLSTFDCFFFPFSNIPHLLRQNFFVQKIYLKKIQRRESLIFWWVFTFVFI